MKNDPNDLCLCGHRRDAHLTVRPDATVPTCNACEAPHFCHAFERARSPVERLRRIVEVAAETDTRYVLACAALALLDALPEHARTIAGLALRTCERCGAHDRLPGECCPQCGAWP